MATGYRHGELDAELLRTPLLTNLNFAEQPLQHQLGSFVVLGIGVPLRLLRDEESPYRFTERQVGPYGTDG